jgi:hypothetical protein
LRAFSAFSSASSFFHDLFFATCATVWYIVLSAVLMGTMEFMPPRRERCLRVCVIPLYNDPDFLTLRLERRRPPAFDEGIVSFPGAAAAAWGDETSEDMADSLGIPAGLGGFAAAGDPAPAPAAGDPAAGDPRPGDKTTFTRERSLGVIGVIGETATASAGEPSLDMDRPLLDSVDGAVLGVLRADVRTADLGGDRGGGLARDPLGGEPAGDVSGLDTYIDPLRPLSIVYFIGYFFPVVRL